MTRVNNTFGVLLFGLLLVSLLSCTGMSTSTNVSDMPRDRMSIKPSPSEVIEKFLDALKVGNYNKAYNYVYAPYTDRSGYVNQMKNMVEDNALSILSYRLLATQIYDRTATVVVELRTKSKTPNTAKTPNTDSIIESTHSSVYDIGLFEGRWLVTGDKCLENCIESEPIVVE